MPPLNWYREIQHTGSGPNYYLSLKFNINHSQFSQQLETLLSKNYTPHKNTNTWSNKTSSTTTRVNLYLQPKATIHIELTWGIEHPEVDELLQQLLSPPYAEKLTQWQVHAGGQGYASKSFGQGADAASFLQYCQAK
ncbi:MAG: hypothetical protein F6K11_07600 [Leptolyngbya sp. SIO3F4]|nr:hypothetical protein [Leptolyngbya sp. SIO3F4]